MSSPQVELCPREANPMVRVPAGEFWHGSTAEELEWLSGQYPGLELDLFRSEVGQRRVHLPAFALDQFPVTNRRYRAFREDGGYGRRELWSAAGWRWREQSAATGPRYLDWAGWDEDEHPVVGVSWWEAEAFARWAGKRLPSEAEWERAARGDDTRRYPWGQRFELGRCNSADHWLGREIRRHEDWESFARARPWRHRVLTTPVDAFPAGVSPCGLWDMAGNVFEWVQDDFLPFAEATGDHGEERVCRGGSFGYYGWAPRTTDRGHHVPGWRSLGIGFRCARDVEAAR